MTTYWWLILRKWDFLNLELYNLTAFSAWNHSSNWLLDNELKTDTEDFNPDNKVGEGRFGPFYKVSPYSNQVRQWLNLSHCLNADCRIYVRATVHLLPNISQILSCIFSLIFFFHFVLNMHGTPYRNILVLDPVIGEKLAIAIIVRIKNQDIKKSYSKITEDSQPHIHNHKLFLLLNIISFTVILIL